MVVYDDIEPTEKIKVYDTIRIKISDTLKFLIIDTLNCNNQTSIGFKNYNQKISISKSILVSDYLYFDNDLPDYIEIYEMSGKCVKSIKVNSSNVSLQDLKSKIYVGLFYRDRKIISLIKIIKK